MLKNQKCSLLGTMVLSALLIFPAICVSANDLDKGSKKRDRATTDYPAVNSLEDRIDGLSRIWSEVKYNFVNLDRLDFDIDSLYRATLPQVISAENDIEYYAVLDRFCASLGDGHTQVLNATYGWNDYFDYIPCLISEFDKKFYFTNIRKNAGIDPALLYAEIIEVEGRPVLQYIEQELFPTISASTYSHKLMQGIVKLHGGPKLSRFNGKARKQNGEIVPFSIIRNGETTRTENDESWGVETPHRDKMIDLEWEDDIAVLQVNTFAREEMTTALDSLAIEINKRASGLIIDLRRNGGGSSDVAFHLQMYLTPSDTIRVFGAQTRVNDAYGRSQGNYREEYADFYLNRAYKTIPAETIATKDYIEAFRMPVVILIGPYSFSACEDLLVNLYEMPGRPVLVGQPTGGSTGAPLMIPLPHDVWARVCSLRITYPYSGKPFVNEGIRPDIVVEHTLDNYVAGNDEDLRKALEYLTSKIK